MVKIGLNIGATLGVVLGIGCATRVQAVPAPAPAVVEAPVRAAPAIPAEEKPVLVAAAPGADAPLLKVGDKAPQFGPVKLHNGPEAGMPSFVLGKYAGDEPENATKGVLISFFATWCGPCKKELPFLVELDRKYREKGLQVVSISIDKDEEAFKQVRELVEKNKIAFPVVMDRYNLLARRYLGEKTALPSVFLVKRDGTIAMVKQGYGEDATAFLTAEVEKILKG